MPRTITQYREQLAAENGGNDPYADLTDQQFAARLHQKHYSDLPFADFAGRVGLQGNYAPAGPPSRPRTNPANNSALTIDGQPNRTQAAMDRAIDLAQPTSMTATRRALPGGTVIPEPADPDADLRALRRLPGNITTQAGALYRRAGAGMGRLTSDINARMASAAAESYRDPLIRPSGAPGGMADGLLEEGTIDLSNRPRVRNEDGSVSTVRSAAFGIEDGKVLLLPTVTDDGRIVSEQEALAEYRRTGNHLGIFDSQESADRYAERLHDAQAEAASFADRQEGAAQGAEERAFQAELAAGRMGRRERQAAADAQAAMPEDAGPIERGLQSGLASTLATAPIVTLGAVVPGGQVPALTVLGGMTGAQRYGELRAAGLSENESALSAAYLGGLEALTEKIPMGAIAKNSPFVNRAAEFMVTDLLGENINTAAQIADDYRLGLNENVTIADVKQALQDTTAATIVGAGATLTMAEITRQVLERANGLAARREPDIQAPDIDIEPPMLTDVVQTVDEAPAGEDITLDGDGEMLPGEIGVEEGEPEAVTLETDPVEQWQREQAELPEDPEVEQVTLEEPSAGPPSIEPEPEPTEDPGPRTMEQRRFDREAKHERIVSAVTAETRPMAVTYVSGQNGWHGVQVDGRALAWYRSEESARSEVRAVRADIAAGNITPAEVDDAIARELPRQRTDRLAHEAATSPKNDLEEPSPKKIEAGTYRKGHLDPKDWHGLNISIENPRGSIRRSKPGAAVTWERKMRDHYGYIRGTEDNTDEHVDVFVGQSPNAESVYVIDQVIDGKFDEPKVMMGYRSQEQAQKAYLRNYQDGWDGIGAITPMSVADFKEWVRSDGPKKPLTWKPPRDERIDANRDRLEYMASRAGWQEIGGQAITQGDAVRADVVGRTKWLPKEPWFAEVQRAAPLPGNKTGMATAAAVAKALGGKKLTAAEDRHIRAMNDAIEHEAAEEERLAEALEKSPEDLSDAELAAVEARLERLSKMLEQRDRRDSSYEPEIPTGRGIVSDEPMFERTKDSRTGDMFGLTPPAGSVTQKPKAKPAVQADLFGGLMDTQTALEKVKAEKDRRRNEGQQSAETGRPDDLFSQAAKQADVEDVSARKEKPAPKDGEIEYQGDTWRVLGIGTKREDGKVYAHLASTTRFQQQKNGGRPIQMADWIDEDIVRPRKHKSASQESLLQREETGGDQVTPQAYASGMSRRGDLEAAIGSVAGVGTVITELSRNGMQRVADAIRAGKPVFVDSGAFSAFMQAMRAGRSKESLTDFDGTLSRYDELAALAGEGTSQFERGLLTFVAPDVVGDQTATLKLLEQHKQRVMDWMEAGIEVIVPFQKGPLKQSEMYRRVAGILGGNDFVVGIPSNAQALSSEDLHELLRQPYKPDRLHILGAVNSKRMEERMQVIREEYVNDVPGVTADANLVRAKMGRMHGLSGAERAETIKRIIKEATSQASESVARKQVDVGDGNPIVGKGDLDQPLFERDSGRRLSVLHNLDESALIWNDELGGIPSPSLGVVKEDGSITGFGNITLIGTEGLADPKKVTVFDADAYSPRVPRPEFNKVRSTKAVQAWVDRLRAIEKEFDVRGQGPGGLIWDNAVNTPNPMDTIARLEQEPVMQAYYLRTVKGQDAKPVMRPRPRQYDWSNEKVWTAFVASVDWKRVHSDREYEEQVQREALPVARAAQVTWLKTLQDATPALKKHLRSSFEKHNVIEDKEGNLLWRKVMLGARDDVREAGAPEVDHSETRQAVRDAIESYRMDYEQWLKKEILSLYSAPFVKVGRQKLPYTLGNIVRAMTVGEIAGAEKTMTFGEGKARALASKVLDSMEHMRNSAYGESGIQNEDDVTEKRKETQKKLEAWRGRVIRSYAYEDTWSALDDSMKALARWAVSGDRSASRLRRELTKLDFRNVPADVIEEGLEAGQALLHTPVPYFEAKPNRAVSLDEFVGAVVPDNVSEQAIAVLEKHGIVWRKYGENYNEPARREAIVKLRRELADIGRSVLFDSSGRQQRKRGGLSERDVRAEVNRILREFKTRPRLMVVQKYEQLPRDLLDANARRGLKAGDARAMQWQGGIYFIADYYHDLGDVIDSVLHETVVHFGLRAVLDRETHAAILDGLWRDQKMAVRRMGVEEFGNRWNSDDPWMRRIAAEEVLAYYAPEYLKGKAVPAKMKPWLQRLIEAIRAFVDRVLKIDRSVADRNFQLPEKFNKREVERIIDALQTYLKEGRTPEYVNDGEALAEQRTVEVERKRYPITNADGQLVAQTPQQQMAFWRWFRGSKVVDARGRPKVLYHGTFSDFDTFDPSKSEDGAFHFGSSSAAADRLKGKRGRLAGKKPDGQNILPVYVLLQNPKRLYSDPEDYMAWQAVIRLARREGHDGIIYPNEFESAGELSYVAFEPNQIKSAIGNRGTFDPRSDDILAERVRRPVFYSALTRAVEQSKTVRAPAAQWMATLKNAPGVKQEEIEWSGVETWLRDLGRPATREQLADYLRANEIRVEESIHGIAPARDENDPAVQLRFAVDDMLVQLDARGYTVVVQEDDEGAKFIKTVVDRRRDEEFEYQSGYGTGVEWVDRKGEFLPDEAREIVKNYQANLDAQAELDAEHQAAYGGENRYENWTLPGGQNYRELLLTLPTKLPAPVTELPDGYRIGVDNSQPADWKWHILPPGQAHARPYAGRHASEAEAVSTAITRINEVEAYKARQNDYRSSHWNEGNILAHVRFNERTDADGKRVLFVEEIQSDWHQAGRRRGYKKASDPSQINFNTWADQRGISRSERDRLWLEQNRLTGEDEALWREWRADADRISTGVPDAPFKTTWPELAFKRVIRWAAENGFDRIAWTTGDQQNARYNLAKHISVVEWETRGDGTGQLIADDVSGSRALSERISEDRIAEFIGVDLTKQLLAQEPVKSRNGSTSYVLHLDASMEIGGDGMRGFYDDILPKAVNKLVKKWGAKVGVSNVTVSATSEEADVYGAGDYETPVHSVDVTPEMRGAALEGLPLFQRNAGGVPILQRTVPKDSGEARGYAKLAGRIIDLWNKKIGHKYGALGNLPESKKYLIERYKTLGGLTQVREISREIFTTLSSADEADSARVYTYLTSRDASADGIVNEAVRNAAIHVKQLIDEQGQSLVEAGLLSEDAYEQYRDQYLPRLYLRHILDDRSKGRMLGSGKKLSDMGYLKQRKDIPEEVRKVILGEITDPAFLAAFGVSRTMRDLTMMNFLETVSQNKAWTPEVMLVDWDGRKVSPYWLQMEAKQLRRQADHIRNTLIAGKARAIADRMDSEANKALEALEDVDLGDFKQIPDSARYGAMRGLWVRREIHEDLVGAYQFIDSDSLLENIFGQGGVLTKATQAWKTSKVAMNVPSHFRNMMGNAMMLHLSGMPLHRLPDQLSRAIHSVATKDEWYDIAKRFGLKEATFANTELYRIRDEWLLLQKSKQPTANKLHAMFKVLTDKVGDVYQFEEALFKIAKLRDAMEREGKGEADAMIESHKWIFDYSLVPRWVRYMRNAPFGIPFLSYAYFVLPRLAEVAVRRPWKFLPYLAVTQGIEQAIMGMYGADDDDLEKLRNAYPEWMRARGGMMLMPWQDAGGRWQVVDMGYTVPWGQLADVTAQVSEGNYRQSAETVGLFSGPLPDIVAAWQTNRDPFTGREIANGGDPKWKQALAIMNYAWGMAAPGFITSSGALGKVRDAHAGRVDPRTGEPTLTKTQAWLRLFGVSIYPVDPETTRARNLRAMAFEINETRRRLGEQLRDRNLTEEQKQEIRRVYIEEIKLRQEKLRRYQEESQVPESLKNKPKDLTDTIGPLLQGKRKDEAVRALRDAGYPALASLFAELPAKPKPGVLEALAEARA